MSEAATKILEESLGRLVLLRLKGGRSLRGKLQGFDQHMNLVLEDAEDISQDVFLKVFRSLSGFPVEKSKTEEAKKSLSLSWRAIPPGSPRS